MMIVPVKVAGEWTMNAVPFVFASDAHALGADDVFQGRVEVRGELSHTGAAWKLTGTIRAVRSFICDRCLAQSSTEKTVAFSEELCPDEEESGIVLHNEDGLDIEGFIRDTLIAAQPIGELCKEDCKGLCPRCGQNLNEGECGCDRTSIDPRLADLAKLLERE